MERDGDRGEELMEVEENATEKATEGVEAVEKEGKEEKTAEGEKQQEEKEKSEESRPIDEKIVAATKMSDAMTTRLTVRNLTRNVTEEHLRMIFSVWGPLKSAEIVNDPVVQLPRGFGHVEFEKNEDAENALDHMNGGQIDGNIVEVRLAQQPKKRDASPPIAAQRQPESVRPHRSDRRPREIDRRRSPHRYHRRSPMRRYSRSPMRRRSPYRHRSRSRTPPRRNYNGGYAYGNRGMSPLRRRSRPPYRGRRRSPSPRYRRREPARGSPSKRSRRSSSSGTSSVSKSSTGSSSSGSSSGSTTK